MIVISSGQLEADWSASANGTTRIQSAELLLRKPLGRQLRPVPRRSSLLCVKALTYSVSPGDKADPKVRDGGRMTVL